MLLKNNILGEPRNKLLISLGDSTDLREVLTPFTVFVGGLLTQKEKKWRTVGSAVNQGLVGNASILKLAV